MKVAAQSRLNACATPAKLAIARPYTLSLVGFVFATGGVQLLPVKPLG